MMVQGFFEIIIEDWQIRPLKPIILFVLPIMVFLGVYLIFNLRKKPLPKVFYYLTGIIILLNLAYSTAFKCACVDNYPYENTLKMTIMMTLFFFALLLIFYSIGKKSIKLFNINKH